MKKGYRKLNKLECVISIRISKQEKKMLEELQNDCFNVSKHFRKTIREVYERNKNEEKGGLATV